MEEANIQTLLQMWNRIFDAVIKFDEKFSEILEEDEDIDLDEEEA